MFPPQRNKQGGVEIRNARVEDGQQIWRLVRESEILDVNSAYCYIMLCSYYSDTCYVAEKDGRIVGFVTSLLPGNEQDVLFVWQIGVCEAHRGSGIAEALLDRLLISDLCNGVRWIETTISPGNTASSRLFAKLASKLKTNWTVGEGFASSLFPGNNHEDEHLVRIGPL